MTTLVRRIPGEAWLAVLVLMVADLTLRLAGDATGGMLALLELLLVVVPLAGLVLGTTRVHHAREVTALLLAQPVSRARLFTRLWRQVTLPLTATLAVGLTVPLAWHRLLGGETLSLAVALVVGVAVLNVVSQGIALVIALRIDDRVRALLVALGTWLVLAVLWDGVALVLALVFADRPMEGPLLAMLLFNPVDAIRIVLLLGSDAAAMLGYTGAVVQRTLGTAAGRGAILALLVAWMLLPLWSARRLFARKDF